MLLKRFFALLSARNKEFLRDRSSLGWNIFMPVMIIAGMAFAFSGGINNKFKVGVIDGTPSPAFMQNFRELLYIEFIGVTDEQRAKTKVERHQLDMLIDAGRKRYWINDDSANGYLVEKLLLSTAGEPVAKQSLSGKAVRYLDWVIPGILAMNMMFSALFGVGYVIVRYRKNGMLKRLKATPLTAFEYLSVQVVSRLLLIMVITVAVFYGTGMFIDYAMYGSHLYLFLVFALGSISMISLGVLVAARVRSEETAGGLLNLLSWPMMFLSGVWFSLEGANPMVVQFAEILPLTHVTAASRAIMIDGAGLLDVSYHLIVLFAQALVFMSLGAFLFRWE